MEPEQSKLEVFFDKGLVSINQLILGSRLIYYLNENAIDYVVVEPGDESTIYIGLVRFKLYCEVSDQYIFITEIYDDGVSFTWKYKGSELNVALLRVISIMNSINIDGNNFKNILN